MAINTDLTDEQAFFGIALVAIAAREKTLGLSIDGSVRKIRDEVLYEARMIARAFVEGVEDIGSKPDK